ncbi:sensor histidine kinase [Tenacibaculum caenipelagi]|uniref:GHKL domain-containing protein n=1 Tax=Tenacibaculum caenipelagi TaxID=1325435 RepID=A0A4R6TFZ7_9FLAO|nr:histidine kinase [Tenacibaculum caenipelagi]TDQ25578.1 GHKL domain-containing protein [Tenacibaculum caenipelagi]
MKLYKIYTQSRILQHFTFWIALFAIYILSYSGNSEYFIYYAKNNGLKFPFYIAAAYTLNYWQVPRFLSTKKYALFILTFVLTSFTLVFLFKLILNILHGYEMHVFNLLSYLSKTLMFYTPALLIYGYQTHQKQQQEKDRLLLLRQEKLDTELKYLKAQLNPHFLFNTLNNLYSFVITNSPKAGDMILQLSEILDYVLYKSQASFIDINEEIKCIENYISLEKIRYGERLHVELHKPEAIVNKQIAPLLLLSIIENAFKHGASGNLTNPTIKIAIHTDQDAIYFDVWNTKNNDLQGTINDSYKEGIGLSNIKRQLNLLYPNKHTLTIEDTTNDFNLKLQLKTI